MDGLLWGVSKLVPVGYGIKKLQIATVVEDDKVSIDELTEKIEAFEDFVSFDCHLSCIQVVSIPAVYQSPDSNPDAPTFRIWKNQYLKKSLLFSKNIKYGGLLQRNIFVKLINF
jgi:hypothetical protein